MTTMKPHIIAAVLLEILISHSLFAQEDNMNEWFLETSPSLLFSVSSLTVTSYEGGIGIGLQRSSDALWRIAVIVSHSSESSTSDPPFQGLRAVTQTRSQLSLFVSPLFPLRNWDALYVFTAPSLQGGHFWSSSHFERMDTSRVSTWRESRSIWNISVGLGLGVGATMSKRISLTAEYRMSLSYTKENEDESQYREVFEEWALGTTASLTLMYKL